MKKIILYTLIVWTFFFLLDISFRLFGIYSNISILDLIIRLLSLNYFLICPFLAIFLIKNKNLKWGLLVVDIVILIFIGPFVCLLSYLLIYNTMNGSGFRMVYEKRLSENKYFSVYRTADEGALGGNHIQYSIDRKLPLGFVKMNILNSGDYKYCKKKNFPRSIIYDKDTIEIDNKILDN